MSKWHSILGICALSAIIFQTQIVQADTREVLTIVAPWHVMSRDPSVSADGFQRLGVAETIVDADETGQLRPGLATDWTVSDDGKLWRFSLREGVMFHDGTPLDLALATEALQRAEARPGVLNNAPILRISADETSVLIETSTPFSALPALLAHSSAVILAPTSYDSDGKPLRVIGSGPFRITALIPPQTMELERFDSYWGDKPSFAKVRYLSASRAEARALMAESGDAQVIHTLDPAGAARLSNVDSVTLIAKPIPRVMLLKLNLGHPVLSDSAVRRALSMAIDREGIAEGILRAPGAAARQLFPPVMAGWHDPDLEGLTYDPAQAKAILADAGWQEGDDGMRSRDGVALALTLRTYPDRSELPIVATALQEQFRLIGVRLDISVANFSEIPAGHQDGSLEMALFSRNYGLSVDPIGAVFVDFADGGGDWGTMGWERADVTSAITAIAQNADPAARAPHLVQLLGAIQEDLPVIPIAWHQEVVAHTDAVTNVTLDPFERSYGLSRIQWVD